MALADAAISVAIDIAKWLVAPVRRQVGYTLFYKKNIRALKSEVEKLHEAIVRLENQRDAALRNGEIVDNKVLKWLEEAKAAEGNVTGQLKDWEIAMHNCFYGWMPNPKTCYVIGRRATKAKLEMQELLGAAKFEIFSHHDVPEGVSTATHAITAAPAGEDAEKPLTEEDNEFDSRALLLKNILDYLVDGDSNVVGVYGPGGVGKTTLLKQVMSRVKAKNLFDEVAMATVSSNPDEMRIQGEISDMLGLTYTVESVHGRGFQLGRRLENSRSQNKKVLIILDDLWKEVDLEKVGVPSNKGVKLLLSSRSLDVLYNKMGSLQNFPIDGLGDAESWKLFSEMVGDAADDPKMKPIAEEMVKKCTGLPILLKALATTLKNGDQSQWEVALEQLRQSKDVYSSLELSYQNLDGDELKSLFLICSLLGHSRIWLDSLLVYTVGLGILDRVPTMKRARERLRLLLRILQASSLLLEDDGIEYVRIHDMVREVAVTIASRDQSFMVLNNDCTLEQLPREKILRSCIISLLEVDAPVFPEGLEYPELKMFSLHVKKEEHSTKLPESFFEGMPQLRVLDFSKVCFNSLPSSIKFLEHLTALVFDYCTLEDIGIIGKLKRLQILSFIGSTISHLPKEISQLSELRMLDLSHCLRLEKIEYGVLKSLTRLEELYMAHSFKHWEDERATEQNNAKLSELTSLLELRRLDILIPDSTLLPSDLPFGNLFSYKILVGNVWDWSSDHGELKSLKLKLDSRETLLDKWVRGTLPSTHDLFLDGLNGIKKSIHELSIDGFHELKHLHVRNSPLVQYVVSSIEWLPCSDFPKLESLSLENLVNLEKICHGHLTAESFSKLKVVKIKQCGKLDNLFSQFFMKNFLQLEEIEVSECKIFRQIIGDVGVEDDSDETMGNAKVEIPNLQLLRLHCLPEMPSLCSEVYNSPVLSHINSEITPDAELHTPIANSSGLWQISFPKLKDLELSQLPKVDEIWSRHSPLELENLRSLSVKECRNLSIIINSHSLLKLKNLETLIVESCMTVKYIFTLEAGPNLLENAISLPRLFEMKLVNLPNLKCMWNGYPRGVLQLRNLKVLNVTKCNGLRYLFPLSAAKALEQLKEMEVSECAMLEGIVTMEAGEAEVAYSLEFKFLSFVILKDMPRLKTFAQGNFSISFPQLKTLDIKGCLEMKEFSMQEKEVECLTAENSDIASSSFFNQKVLLPSLENLVLSMVSFRTIWCNEDLISEPSSFRRLNNINFSDCKNLTTVFPSALLERIQSRLKKAEIYRCPSVDVIFETAAVTSSSERSRRNSVAAVMLYGLEQLNLSGLPKLKYVVVSDSQSRVVVGFPSLKEILVETCHSLTYFIPTATARTLLKLEHFNLGSCNSMLEVVAHVDGRLDNIETVSFPRLSALLMWNLRSLTSFSSGGAIFDFPTLENLEMDNCDKFETFIRRPATATDHVAKLNCRRTGDDLNPVARTEETLSGPALFDDKTEFPSLASIFLCHMGNLQKLWNFAPPVGSFRKLKSLTVKECNNLPAIFQSDVMRSFLNLEMLEVESCDSLEEVFRMQREGGSSSSLAVIYVPLRELKMERLPLLKHVWDKDARATLAFDKLERVRVDRCGNLGYLFPASVARGLVQLQEIDIIDCAVMEELIMQEEVSEEDDTLFPHLRDLFPRLTSLKCRRLQHMKRLSPINYSVELSSLKRLFTYDCGELKILSDLRTRVEGDYTTNFRQALPSLEKVVSNLESLALGSDDILTIQDGDFPDDIFRNLKSLCLASSKEGFIGFPSRFLLERFSFLEMEFLVLAYFPCKEIFPDEVRGPEGITKALGKLRELSLVEMHNLSCLWKEGSFIAEILKKIELLCIESCHCLEFLLPAPSDSFKNLTKLEIFECDGLTYLMTASAARGLPKLARLAVVNCKMIGAIMSSDDATVSRADIVFPMLQCLELYLLPSLTSFSAANCSIAFPLLEDATVTKCPDMKIFSTCAVSAPKLYKVNAGYSWWWFDDLNTTIQKIHWTSKTDS